MAKKDDEAKVRRDIIARDRADIDKGYRGSRVFRTSAGDVPMYPEEFGRLSKTDKMAYKDALEREYRRGDNWTLAQEAGINPKLEGKPISRAEGDATRKRLIDRYKTEGKAKGGKVKKMAAGGSASRRADGCATKGKTKGRFV